MTIDSWIADREDDNFIILDEDGNMVYDGRKTRNDPALYIVKSVIVDIYTWNGVTVLAI